MRKNNKAKRPHTHTQNNNNKKNTSPKHPEDKTKQKNNLPCLHLAAVEVSKLFLKQYENIFHIYMDAFSNSPARRISPEKARMLRSINKFMSLMS